MDQGIIPKRGLPLLQCLTIFTAGIGFVWLVLWSTGPSPPWTEGLQATNALLKLGTLVNAVTPPCDLIQSPEEFPPSGFCGPRILIIGAMKCGTNQMRAILIRHPRIATPEGNKENHFFTHATVEKTINPFASDARRHYMESLPAVTANGSLWSYDKSPSYLDTQEFPRTPHLAHRLLPSARVIAIVCEPVSRAWSQFNHMKRYGEVPDSVQGVLDLAERTDFDYVKNFVERGFYANHLQEWMAAYGPANVFVANFDEMTSEDRSTQEGFVRKLLAFLDLPSEEYDWENAVTFKPWERHYNPMANYSREPPPEVVDFLAPFYQDKNVELAELLGRDYPRQWNELYTKQRRRGRRYLHL